MGTIYDDEHNKHIAWINTVAYGLLTAEGGTEKEAYKVLEFELYRQKFEPVWIEQIERNITN